MTYKQFKQWCNERACDGCWGMQVALLCIDVMKEINRLPFWKREKVWKQIEHRMLVEVITPTNKIIQGVTGAKTDRGN